MKNNYYFAGVNPTVDLIIISPENKILLVKRGENASACPNMLAIPGGFIDTKANKGEEWKPGLETPEQAAIREVQEETNLKLDNPALFFVGIFEGDNRDPRDSNLGWSKSYAFLHIIDPNVFEEQKDQLLGMDDVTPGKDGIFWIDIEEINSLDLAFDHKKIISQALTLINKNNNKIKLK